MNSDDEYDLLKDHVSTLVSLCGDSQHDCGYCDGKDTSRSFGIWAHFMSCSVRIFCIKHVEYKIII